MAENFKIFFMVFLLASWMDICSAKTDCPMPVGDVSSLPAGLDKFIEAGGCLSSGSSVSNPLLPAPFYLVNSLSDKDLPKESAISIFDNSSPVRSILDQLVNRDDVLVIIKPVAEDNSGAVLSEATDSDTIQKLKNQFKNIPNIDKIKIVFSVGVNTLPVTVAHENQHVADLLDGKLPLSKDDINKLNSDLMGFARVNTPTDAEYDLVTKWISTMRRTAPEIGAIKAEYDYLKRRGETKLSFANYLKNSSHDYIGKNEGLLWLNGSFKNDAHSPFAKQAAARCCEYAKKTLALFGVNDFDVIYTNCDIEATKNRKSAKAADKGYNRKKSQRVNK